MNKQEKIRRAYAQVLGKPGCFVTDAQLIVYEHMVRMSKKPAARKNVTRDSNGELCPYETMAQTAVRDSIIATLKLADYESDENKTNTK